MKNEKGVTILVLIITIVVIIILSVIAIGASGPLIDDSINAKEDASANMDDDKIKSIIAYELAENYDLIDEEIDLKRIELNNNLQITYEEKTYGSGYVLYIGENDIEKVAKKTGKEYYYKAFQKLGKSYIVNMLDGSFIRLKNDWKFDD